MMYENRVSGTTRVCTGLTRRPSVPVALADRGAQTTFSKTLHRRDTHISLQRISFAKATTYQKGKLIFRLHRVCNHSPFPHISGFLLLHFIRTGGRRLPFLICTSISVLNASCELYIITESS